MRMVDLIEKKRDGKILSREEIRFIINGYVSGEIPDYQISALAMAIYFQGMNAEETAELTLAMAESGKQLDLSISGKTIVDKHSTGGVGDKTTLVVAPLVASCGVPIAKMSGRGLGHTGGTIDKLSSIPGFKVELTEKEFFAQVETVGFSVIAQTGNLVPADKKLYSLRDVTATVNSIPLIASSIMSKKIAAGAQGIVLDVKFGSGAFMPNETEAEKLARAMVGIGKNLGRDTIAVLSNMNQPLGKAVGNSLEVLEAIDTLQGNGPQDLLEVCLMLGSWMLIAGKKTDSLEEAENLLKDSLNSGAAWNKFLDFVSAQKGNVDAVINRELSVSPRQAVYKANKTGYIQNIDARKIGLTAMILGAGRETKESSIDLGAGVYLLKKPGEPVKCGDPVARLYTSDESKLEYGLRIAAEAVSIGEERPLTKKMVSKVIK